MKIGANTPQAFKPPNSTRAQKPHKPRKAPKPSKPHKTPQNALKTPLKREIEPYLQTTHQAQSSKGRASGNILSYLANVSKIARVPRPPAPSGHTKRQASGQILSRSLSPHFKNILVFRLFRSPIFPRLDKIKQINVYF